MQSARERKPSTGKSNLNQTNGTLISSSRSTRSLDTARIRELNDPLTVHRPYTPEIKQETLARNPAMPQSRYQTIPDDYHDPGFKKGGVFKWHKTPMGAQYRKPTICTSDWLNKNTELTWFEAADFRSLLDHDNKRQFARQFIERNKDRMWIYNRSFINKDHSDIAEEMIESPHFMMDMVVYNRQEKSLGIGQNSDKIYASFDETKLSVPKAKLPSQDNFLSTITTSRQEREERIKKLLIPATANSLQSIHRRGYKHDASFGNFSLWNGVLKTNGM